jgi:hypothetical protein
MLLKWMKFSRDAARLGYEVQTVMTLRMLKFARGGKAAKTEARRMVAEKGLAFAEAAATLATGGSMKKVVRRVRSRVSKNKRRLSRASLRRINAPPFLSPRPYDSLRRPIVRYGSLADIGVEISDVRFTPESGHAHQRHRCPLCAMCGRLLVGKSKLDVALLVGAAMCSAC